MAQPSPARTGQLIRQRVQQQARLPAPVGGLNYVDGTMGMPVEDAWVLDNFVVRPHGIEVRKGWRYWTPNANSLAGEVRSVMVYNAKKPQNSKLWASSASGTGQLYEIPFNVAPIMVLNPSTLPVVVGEWYGTNYVTPGGSFFCTVTHGGGYYVYKVDEATNVGTWTEIITGPGAGQVAFPPGDTTTSKDLCFIWPWKSRLWFLKRHSSVAYYLPTNAISGQLQAFDFGGQLIHGGNLDWASSWTYDSGAGIDDGLLVASEQGDILVYQGTDPASAANFALKGTWYAGRFPLGRRGFAQHGGDVLILTEYGIISVSDLVSGRIQSAWSRTGVGQKVNPQLSRIVSNTILEKYWSILLVPSEGVVMVYGTYRDPATGLYQGFFMNSISNTWSTYTDIDVLSANIFQGQLIIGTRLGQIIQGFRGYSDGASPDELTIGNEVTGRIMTSFQDYGSAVANKRMLRCKMYGLVDSDPAVYVTFKPEYEVNQMPHTPSPTLQARSIWDIAIWDRNLWADVNTTFKRWFGVSGFGKKMSMQAAVRSNGAVLITDFEVLYETGIGL